MTTLLAVYGPAYVLGVLAAALFAGLVLADDRRLAWKRRAKRAEADAAKALTLAYARERRLGEALDEAVRRLGQATAAADALAKDNRRWAAAARCPATRRN